MKKSRKEKHEYCQLFIMLCQNSYRLWWYYLRSSFHNSFRQKAESLQYNGAIAIAGAIRGTSRENIYQELDLKSVYQRRWYKNLCFFSDIFKI